MTLIKRRSLIVSLLVGALALTSSISPMAQAAGQTIRVGYFANITHAQALLGFGQGVFARDLRGVNVQGTVFAAGPDEMAALFAGAIDIGYIGPGPAINGYVKSNGGVTIIAGSATGGAVLVARAGSGIKTVADLAGKRVAIPQIGNTQDIELRQLLKDNGLAPSETGGSVRILAVNNADTLALFTKSDLDAALVPEPWGTRLVKETGATIVLDWQQLYGGAIPATVVIVATPFYKAHPDLVVRFLRAHAELTRYLSNNATTTNTRNILNAQIKQLTGKALADDVIRSALTKTAFTTALHQRDYNQFVAFSISAGYLKRIQCG